MSPYKKCKMANVFYSIFLKLYLIKADLCVDERHSEKYYS